MKRLYALLPLLFLASCSSNPSTSSGISSLEELSSTETSSSKVSSAESSFAESSSTRSSSSEVISSSQESSSSFSSEEISSSQESSSKIGSPYEDPYLGRQYYLHHLGGLGRAWQDYSGEGVTIAVIDCGFDAYHEDFTYADGTSKVSPSSAYFHHEGGAVSVDVGLEYLSIGGESHGTFCAGVAAAGANGKGVVGVAPGAELLLLKTDLKPRSIAKAFTYAADNGAKVVTISIGSYYDYNGDLLSDGSDLGTVFDAPVAYCRSKGVAVISAGGNGGEGGQPTEFTFPGCVDGVIGVGGLAANSSSEIWDGSSYNSSPVYTFCDVFAPAEGMFGCVNYGGKQYDGGLREDGEYAWNGTSFASPCVAGLAALYFQANPNDGVEEFEEALFSSCLPLQSSKITSSQWGYGRVDACRLLGLTRTSNANISLKANWDKAYAYAWDSLTGNQFVAWPGVEMSKANGIFTSSVDPSYDSLIFSSSGQTVDLDITFLDGHCYDLTSPIEEKGNLIGTFVS